MAYGKGIHVKKYAPVTRAMHNTSNARSQQQTQPQQRTAQTKNKKLINHVHEYGKGEKI